MDVSELMNDALGRVRDLVRAAVEGLSDDDLAWRPDPEANSIGWLVWHLTRIEDDHVADLAGTEQVWTAQGWHARSGVPFEPADTGYGHSSDDVAAVRLDAEQLLGYADAVHDAVVAYVGSLTDEDLPRVVDERWDPPVTLAVRLVSVIGDGMQHAGQAAFVRGVIERRR